MSLPVRLCLLAAWLGSVAEAGDLWVSPAGNDQNPGTFEAPLATPAQALRVAREWRRLRNPAAEDGIRIQLTSGTYFLEDTLRLRPEDSGTENRPLVIQAAPGASPVLSGGRRITDWKPAGAELPARLPETARPHLWVAEIPVFKGRTLEFRQLWVDGRKATRARTPNGESMERLVTWKRPERTAGLPASLALPADLRGVEMVLLQAWEIAVLRLSSATAGSTETTVRFHEPESRVQFEHPWPPPPMPGKDGKNAPFFLANAPEFLDEPGEWFADVATGRLYYWPRDGENLATAEVIAPALEQLVRVAGTFDRPVANVRFEGLTFAHSTWLRPSHAGHVPLQTGFYLIEAYSLKPKGTPDWRSLDNQAWLGRPAAAVSAHAARDISWVGCRFAYLAANGLDLHLGVQNARIEGNVFRDVGISSIVAGSFGEEGFEAHLPYDPADEREHTAHVVIANNVIRDNANEDWGGVALSAGFVRDCVIAHNDIRDTSYTGINVGWGWTRTANVMRNNRVHANRLERVATRTADNAGIYTLSNQPGTVISENVVLPIRMSPFVHDPDHWFYLYTDEGSSFIEVRDNWVPEEKFLENATGPGNRWTNNGPHVDTAIRDRAGLEPAWRDRLAEDLAR